MLDAIIDKYPSVLVVKSLCKRKVPRFVWDYFDSAAGRETMTTVDREGLDKVLKHPRVLATFKNLNLSVKFLGLEYSRPYGVAPIGMVG